MQKKLWIAGLLFMLFLGASQQIAQAASGLPDSPQFGYGVRINTDGQTAESFTQPIQMAARSGLDWIALDFDWAGQAPSPGETDSATLDAIMALASQNQLHVLISITHPPAWSIGPSGPDSENVAELVLSLARKYPGTLLAIELFPAANMAQGWGTQPDPQAYVQMFQHALAAIQAAQVDVSLIAGGLTPLPQNPSPGDMDDAVFLAALYENGGRDVMPVISIRLPELSGEPLTPPTSGRPPCLRHIEIIRQVMLDHDHAQGLLWISGFSWPAELNTDTAQADWLAQAYELLQARLYLGAAFFNSLRAAAGEASLILPDNSVHPGLTRLARLIYTRRAETSGQPGITIKQMRFRPNFKPQR